MKYELILFDIDGTLLDFQLAAQKGMEETLAQYGIEYSDEIITRYNEINQQLWEDLEQGKVTKERLVLLRFERFFEWLKVDCDPIAFNQTYQEKLGQGAYLLTNGKEICEELLDHCKLAVVTNGVSTIQYSRLKKSGLDQYFDHIIVSEDAKATKPSQEFFDYAFRAIGEVNLEKTLIVGDSLSADIKGGNNAGIATCWYNPMGVINDYDVHIDYEITDLMELKNIVLGD